ncbi:MAG TPA: TonB-dependent receptor plug domain-containing protein, partial [Salinivirgaceae bacterium]|nr:TonB-dependent receptor plug domain-containing protein [Salinivirgaceae bacterium]
LVFFFIPQIILSQESITIDTLYNLKEITITDKRLRKADEMLQPMQRLTKKELEIIPAQTNADYLKNFSGVTLKDYGGIGGLKTINVRSLGANHTTVTVDGIQLSDAATGQIDLGKIPAGDYSEIALHIGQPTDNLLTARSIAAASLVEFQSNKPFETQQPLELSIGMRSGSYNLIKPFSHLQWTVTPKLNFSFSSTYEKADGKYPYKIKYGPNLDSTHIRQNSDIETLNLSAAVNIKPNATKKIELCTFFYDSRRGLPGAAILYQPYSNQRLWNRDFTANLRFRNEDTTRFNQQTVAKFSHSFLRYLDPDYLNATGAIDNRYTQEEFYASNVFDIRITEKITTSIATDYQINQLSTNLPEWEKPYRHTLLGAHSMRINMKKIEFSESILFTGIYDIRNNGECRFTKLSPTLMLGYTFPGYSQTKIKFLYKSIFRAPTFNDLYYTLVGNPSLKPENASLFNLNLWTQPLLGANQTVSFTIDVFYNRVTDKIIAIPTKNLFEWSMQNIGEVEIKGVTLQTSSNFSITKTISFSLNGNYTFQQSFDVTTPGSSTYRNQIPYVPFETASIQSALQLKNFTIATTTLFNGFRYTMAENLYENMLPHWLTHDLALIWDIPMKWNTLNLRLDITNITNQDYEVIRSFPMPGRAFFFTLKLKI